MSSSPKKVKTQLLAIQFPSQDMPNLIRLPWAKKLFIINTRHLHWTSHLILKHEVDNSKENFNFDYKGKEEWYKVRIVVQPVQSLQRDFDSSFNLLFDSFDLLLFLYFILIAIPFLVIVLLNHSNHSILGKPQALARVI